jgi:uncharacterized protein YcbK (DUF882 family)
MNLSKNFTLDELTHSEVALRNGWDNSPPPAVYENLIRLANLLEQVRFFLGKPILINSAYRSKLVNDSVGSKDTSQHRLGCAADIRISGMTPEEVTRTIKYSDIQFDQLIKEFDSWVHISVPNNPNETPRKQTLIIDKQGTRQYI